MIIDRQNDPNHASRYIVYDEVTHAPIDIKSLHIWYVDDERGIIRRYLFDEYGDHVKALMCVPDVPLTEEQIDRDHAMHKDSITYFDPQLALAWVEERRLTRIIRKV